MARVRKISEQTRKRHKFERTLVWLKYCSPAILTLFSWFSCLVRGVRFYDGEQFYSLQSVNEMVTQAIKGMGSFDAAKDDSYTELLAGALGPVTTAYTWCFIIAGVLSLYLLIFAIAILIGDPMSEPREDMVYRILPRQMACAFDYAFARLSRVYALRYQIPFL